MNKVYAETRFLLKLLVTKRLKHEELVLVASTPEAHFQHRLHPPAVKVLIFQPDIQSGLTRRTSTTGPNRFAISSFRRCGPRTIGPRTTQHPRWDERLRHVPRRGLLLRLTTPSLQEPGYMLPPRTDDKPLSATPLDLSSDCLTSAYGGKN
ncbi:hypothetical protein Bca4012_063898 [Brassica carinata]